MCPSRAGSTCGAPATAREHSDSATATVMAIPARADAAVPSRFRPSTSASAPIPAILAGTAGNSACSVSPKVAA